MLGHIEILARAIPAALASGATAGGTTTVAAAAASGSLATAGVLGGVAAILGTAGGLIIQWRKAAAEDVPALRRRLKAAELSRERLERKHDVEVDGLREEVAGTREQLLAVERALYAAERALVRLGAPPQEEGS